MKKCLLCGQNFVPELSFRRIFSFRNYREQCLCQYCLAKFERLTERRCNFCSKEISVGATCRDCLEWKQKYNGFLLKHQAVYRYNITFHELMVNYKRYGDYILNQVLQELCYQELYKIKADFYVPLPTAPEHIKKRQFDTVRAIYDDLLPLTLALGKNSGFDAQGEKNRKQRLKSRQSFFVKENLNIDMNFKRILLLDDIYTTGRTLYHARDALCKAFPQAIIASFSICR